MEKKRSHGNPIRGSGFRSRESANLEVIDDMVEMSAEEEITSMPEAVKLQPIEYNTEIEGSIKRLASHVAISNSEFKD